MLLSKTTGASTNWRNPEPFQSVRRAASDGKIYSQPIVPAIFSRIFKTLFAGSQCHGWNKVSSLISEIANSSP